MIDKKAYLYKVENLSTLRINILLLETIITKKEKDLLVSLIDCKKEALLNSDKYIKWAYSMYSKSILRVEIKANEENLLKFFYLNDVFYSNRNYLSDIVKRKVNALERNNLVKNTLPIVKQYKRTKKLLSFHTMITFGKYKGYTPMQLLKIDYQYLTWLLRTWDGYIDPKLNKLH